MEETPVSMVSKRRNTAISQRRERRRERILRNSDQRIRTILSGPDGIEERNAPALEDGESFKDLVQSSEISISDKRTATSKSTVSSSFSYTSVNRLWKALLIGLIMRLGVSFMLIQNIVWPWTILYMLLSVCNANGYVLCSRLRFELNIDLFYHIQVLLFKTYGVSSKSL
ncbi:BMA-VPS-16 [Dirofilaria immitis]|nr:BMA-VPS-16 [Dirofilaria immitis]